MPPDIPERVLQFLAEKIDDVPQLEALLLLWENSSRSWSCEEIAARIYVRAAACTNVLQMLARRDLLTVEPSSQRYQYNPAWDPDGSLITEVSAAYRRQLVQVTRFIHSRAPSSVREFARAFDFKKER